MKNLWFYYNAVFGCAIISSVISAHQMIDEQSPAYLFSLHHLYPQHYYYRIETALKQLSKDLDIVLEDSFLVDECLDNSHYFYEQGKHLERSVLYFVQHGYDTHHYLTDDLHYLLYIMQEINDKLVQIFATSRLSNSKVISYLAQITEAISRNIGRLLENNREIVL